MTDHNLFTQPLKYDVEDNERELVAPAIKGVRSILDAAVHGHVRRIVLTSSFAAILDTARSAPPFFTYTAQNWNPITYAEATDPRTSPVVAYRGAKTFAEREAWNFVRDRAPPFDLVTLCPPMTFGPMVHPVEDLDQLNESNSMLWKVASGCRPLPQTRVPFWTDVRTLAQAHVEALTRPEAGGKRYVVSSSERFSYELATEIIASQFPWAAATMQGKMQEGEQQQQAIDRSYGLDGQTAARELGLREYTFSEMLHDFVTQAAGMRDTVSR